MKKLTIIRKILVFYRRFGSGCLVLPTMVIVLLPMITCIILFEPTNKANFGLLFYSCFGMFLFLFMILLENELSLKKDYGCKKSRDKHRNDGQIHYGGGNWD